MTATSAVLLAFRPAVDAVEADLLCRAAHQCGAGRAADPALDDPALDGRALDGPALDGPALDEPRSMTLVATLDGEVAGFVRALLRPGDPRQADLDLILVFERHRRAGIGRLLLDELCARLLHDGRTLLQVLAQPWAETFFRRVGARRTGSQRPGPAAAWSRPVYVLDTRRPGVATPGPDEP